jgi:OFA family oxalate/formate antiporter-like MFS transporter
VRGAAALAAATALNLPFGTLYAFSVLLKPVESLLGVTRAEMSVVFALATITLTAGMNVAPALYRRFAPSLLCAASGLCAATGLLLSAAATTYSEFALGYGVLTGFGAGVGFTVVQQAANQVSFSRPGLANGYVVSLYPLGAMIGAPLLGWGIEAAGLRGTLAALGALAAGGCFGAAFLLRGARMQAEHTGAAHDPQWPLFWRLWAVFLLAAAAGLMVMSQAAGIVQAYGGATALALAATSFITGMIGAARIAGGWLTDRFAVPHVAIAAHACSLAGAVMLTLWPNAVVAIPSLAMIGMGYGLVSGLTAAAIGQYWHRNDFGMVSSRLYIAWCVAALSLPILAGWLYDRTQAYGTAVLIAAAVNVAGIAIAAGLPRPVAALKCTP